MNRANWMKKLLVGTLTLSMVAGGATSAFAKGKPHWAGHGDDDSIKIEIDGNKIELKINFDDVDDAGWAWKYIAALAAQGVFNGYGDGTFRPQQVITQIEAITAAVRLMGLEAEAKSEAEMKTELNFKDAEKIEQKYPWAVGYVAVAAENDLFLETATEVQPEKKASRLWATMLLVKALKLEDEAKARMNAKLTFKDAEDIPAGAVGYVALAVEKGLITGYGNGTFLPNKPVTRAELAALLSRTDGQMPEAPDQANGQYTGSVSTVTADTVTIVKDGQATTLNVAANAFVWRNNQKVLLTSLIAGDQVTVHMYQGVATFIEVTTPATGDNSPVYTAAGKYQSHHLNAEGKIDQITILQEVAGQNPRSVIYPVAPTAQISGGNAFSLISGQTQLELLVVNQVVSAITIK